MEAHAFEDHALLERLARGYAVDFPIDNHFDLQLSAITRQGIQLEAFVSGAIQSAKGEEKTALLMNLLHGQYYGYAEQDAERIALHGLQFNTPFGNQLPAQSASVSRNSGIRHFEMYSRDLGRIRGMVFAYEVYVTRRLLASDRLHRMLGY